MVASVILYLAQAMPPDSCSTIFKGNDGYNQFPISDDDIISPSVFKLETCSIRSKIKCKKCRQKLFR